MPGPEAAVVIAAAKALVDNPSEVKVTETVHRGVTVLELIVAPGDVGRVVGRHGRTAEALRTLVAATAHHHGHKATLGIRGQDGR
ncbi:MAG TPA: KH domain-containing protein [Vicinamibacterales bacterium]|nr:KH domain-containing protein [Vicinamibacterales bacterium]